MDERHWWLATKIQESFGIGGYDNPTMLEDFMCQEETMQAVNSFFAANGPCRIFFYCERSPGTELSARNLRFTDSLSKLRDTSIDNVYILFFLRHDTTKDVDLNHFEKDIMAGEIKRNAVEHITAMLSDVYLPALRNQRDWGQCTEENRQACLNNLERLTGNLAESASNVQAAKQQVWRNFKWSMSLLHTSYDFQSECVNLLLQMLRPPDNIISNDFKQHRLAALDTTIFNEYENLVTDWMNTIENVLLDSSDERYTLHKPRWHPSSFLPAVRICLFKEDC